MSDLICDFWKLHKMMKNVFYFTLKALFVLKTFKSLSWPVSSTNNYSEYIPQYPKKQRQSDNEIWSVDTI